MRVLRVFPLIALIVTFGVGASEREIGPRDGDFGFVASSESLLVTLGADNSVVAVAKASPMLMHYELQPLNLNHPFAVLITSTGEVFTRVVGVQAESGKALRLLIPYNESWNIDRVIISGLRNEAGLSRNVAFSRDQLTATLGVKGPEVTTNLECFIVGDYDVICFRCWTIFGVELCRAHTSY